MGGRTKTVRRKETTVSYIITNVAPSNNNSLRLNEPGDVGTVINTAGTRGGMGSPVSTMNVSTTDSVSGVNSSNSTTPSAGGQVTYCIQSHKSTHSHVVCLNLWLLHRWENSVGKVSQKQMSFLQTGLSN